MKQCFIRSKAIIGGFVLLFCLFLVPAAGFAYTEVSSTCLTSLEQIEKLIDDGPEVSAALTAIARDEALETLARQRTGAKYFWGITYGYSDEPIFDTSEEKNTYKKLSLTGGLNFPLQGALQKEKIRKLEAETDTIKSKQQSRLLILHNLVALRKAYATLWIEQQKEAVVKRFLSTEAETVPILQDRQQQGLMLPVDTLELQRAYQEAKRDLAAAKLQQLRALQLICLATGHKWDMTEKLKAPSLPSIEDQNIDLNNHPEAALQSSLVSQYEKLYAEKRRIDREASLTIGLTAARDFPGSTGNGAYIAYTMTEPVKELGANDQAKLAAGGDLDRVKKEELIIRLRLNGQAEEALATAAYAAADVNARQAHLIVMAESIREKMLRRLVLPGDTFEQLQQSKAQYYRTALEMLNQEELFLHSVIDIISYVYPRGLASEATERVFPIDEHDTLRNTLLAPYWLDSKNMQAMSEPLDFSGANRLQVPVIPFGANEKITSNSKEKMVAMPLEKLQAAVYVWDAQPFLQSATRITALNEIIDAGFSRVLLSFTNEQTANLVLPQGKEALNALIAAAKSKGVRLDLMLGEPTWAEPAHRGELLALIKQLEKFDFAGIHLDIEPDSLPGAPARRAELLIGLADTIKAVQAITTRPISISIHPRYLEGELGALARQRLLPLGLEEVVVMIYSNNPYLTAQRMSAIIASNPSVPFSLAQSVEESIPSAESYANDSRQTFNDAMQLLESKLAVDGLKGLFIQSWEEYRKRGAL